jgi:hypothetical protein
MKLTIEFDGDKLISDLMQNYPEASSSSLQCTKWKYNDMVFTFVDTEENKTYTVDLPKLRIGLEKLLSEILAGKLPGLGLSGPAILDAGSWDAYSMDALVQMSIFGEVIYG